MLKNYSNSKLIDCTQTQEKSVLKKVLKEGIGTAVAENGQEVTIDYICAYEDGSIIDSSYEKNRKLQVVLGSGQLIQGLECGLLTMKKQEKSFFKIRPCMNYSKVKSNLPDNRTLIFEVELHDWKPVDLSPVFDNSILKTMLKQGEKSYIFPKPGKEVTLNIKGFSFNKEFDQRTVTFNIFENAKENNICLGVELCVLTMKQKEISKVIVKKKYAFSDIIPEEFKEKLDLNYQELVYEIELVSFELDKDVWEMTITERFEEAIKSKKKGSEFYAQNKFDAAARHYQRIINYIGPDERHNFKEKNEEKNSLLKAAYLNLAQVNLKINKGLEAISAADMMIKLDDKNVKAYYRRGLGHLLICNYEKAINDFDNVLNLEPNNSAAKKQKVVALQELKKAELKEKKVFQGMFEKLSKNQDKNEKLNEDQDVFSKMDKVDPEYLKFEKEIFKIPKNLSFTN